MTPQYPCVYKRDGKYAKHSFISTHTGDRNIVTWTDDLQEATVFYTTPTQLMWTNLLDGAEPIPVSEHRTVTILLTPKSLCNKGGITQFCCTGQTEPGRTRQPTEAN